MRPLCRHCLRVPVNRPRGLCWHCYYAPGVREQYPSTSKYGRWADADPQKSVRARQEASAADEDVPAEEPPLPAAEATTAPAGSLAKIEVMRARAARREELHHAADSRCVRPRPRKGKGGKPGPRRQLL